MDEKMIYVPLELFSELMELKGREQAFERFVNSTKYSIDRGDCAAILGFELKQVEENV